MHIRTRRPRATSRRRALVASTLALGLASGLQLYTQLPAHAAPRTQDHANAQTVTIPDSHVERVLGGTVVPAKGPAATYPLATTVTDPGSIVDVDVTVSGIDHEFADDLDIMLVAPSGRTVLLMSDAGGSDALNSQFYRFDDDASTSLRDNEASPSGSYQPSDFGSDQDFFPAPAPNPAAARTSLRELEGTTATGTWRVYVVDDSDGDRGDIESVVLRMTTTTVADPYPSTIQVGQTGPITDVDVTLHGLEHSFPADLQLALVGPGGRAVLLMSGSGGSNAIAGADLTFDDERQPIAGEISAGGAFQPTGDLATLEPFPAPGPATGALDTRLSAFDGLSAGGAWNLYARDTQPEDTGRIITGWSLHITTDEPDAPAPPPATPAIVDHSAPLVIGTHPGRSGRIGTGKVIRIRFSEDIAPSSIRASRVTLTRRGARTPVAAKLQWRASTNSLLLRSRKPLTRGATYVLRVSTQLRDLSGNRLDQAAKNGLQPFTARLRTR